MVKIRTRKTMKRNKIKKQHQKHSRKHKKTIKQKRQYKRGKYSKILRGGDICLKEVTDKTPPEVNRIGDENTNLPKKTSWGLGTLFGNKKTETPPIETTPIKENKIIDENTTTDIIENPLLSSEIEETSIVPPPPGPGDAGFVIPPPPSTPNPYLNPYLNPSSVDTDDKKSENSEIKDDLMSIPPPPPPPAFKNPINMLDQIKEGVKLKSVDNSNIPPPPPGSPSKNTSVFEQGLIDKFKNTGMNKDDEKEEEDQTWRDSEGGKTSRKIKSNRKKRKNTRRKMKK